MTIEDQSDQYLKEFEDALISESDTAPNIICMRIAEKYNISKQKIFVDFYKKHQTHVFNYRDMMAETAENRAASRLHIQIQANKDLDIFKIGNAIAEAHDVEPLALAKAFRRKYGAGPAEYHIAEWNGFPNGGGNAAAKRAKERMAETARNNAERLRQQESSRIREPVHRAPYMSSQNSAYYQRAHTPSRNTGASYTYTPSKQEQAWNTLKKMASDAREIVN